MVISWVVGWRAFAAYYRQFFGVSQAFQPYLAQYSRAQFAVSYGMVSGGSLNDTCSRRLENPAGETCSYTAAPAAKGRYDLTATVVAGMIKL